VKSNVGLHFEKAAQQSAPAVHWIMQPIPRKERQGWRAGSRRVFTCACGAVYASSFLGFKLVPSKRR